MFLNNEAYTAYPSEGEVILMEGFAVTVLEVEKKVKVKNTFKSMKKYNGLTLTIVYLFHWLFINQLNLIL